MTLMGPVTAENDTFGVAALTESCEVTVLALLVWREARGESRAAKVAVAATVLNRVKRPTWWGSTVLSVCFKKWQYSSLTDPHDPQLTTWPSVFDGSWIECLQVAQNVLHGAERTTMPGADSYFDESIAAPPWATPETCVGRIGRLKFYNVDRDHETVEG
jgi:N-acetylmuramoyl-L-alanine amidase